LAEKKASRWIMALVVVAGLGAGAASAVWTMKRGGLRGDGYEGWYGSSVAGSIDADPWTRAKIALTGLLALNKSQAIYFTRNTDDQGERLREGCSYRVSGGAMPGSWWSVTVYADDDYLPMNDDDALSFDATEVSPDAQGQWTATVADKRPESGAWASSRKAGAYTLTLRIYQPSKQAQDDLGSVPKPKVTKLVCGGAA
jgi:hypothetical protein